MEHTLPLCLVFLCKNVHLDALKVLHPIPETIIFAYLQIGLGFIGFTRQAGPEGGNERAEMKLLP